MQKIKMELMASVTLEKIAVVQTKNFQESTTTKG
jgi:hypothetical protein